MLYLDLVLSSREGAWFRHKTQFDVPRNSVFYFRFLLTHLKLTFQHDYDDLLNICQVNMTNYLTIMTD